MCQDLYWDNDVPEVKLEFKNLGELHVTSFELSLAVTFLHSW